MKPAESLSTTSPLYRFVDFLISPQNKLSLIFSDFNSSISRFPFRFLFDSSALCMAVRLSSIAVSDLCIGKPALRSLSAGSATVADALSALKRFDESYISVWSCDHSVRKRKAAAGVSDIDQDSSCRCIGRVCMVDIICFLCKEENLLNPASALQSPVSVLLSKDSGLVRHLEPSARFVILICSVVVSVC